MYDAANQLIRENNQKGGFTYIWTYDDAGNILSRHEYAYTTGTVGALRDTVTYTYGNASNKDILTAYDGAAITRDAIGNPLSDGTWTYTWEHGRQLKSMSDGTVTWNYTYNADGMRTSRTNGSKTYEYIYNGSQLSRMTISENGTTTTYDFTYDAEGAMVLTVNGYARYIYVKNLQGDIIAILDAERTAIVEYTYDAWGNIISIEGSAKDSLGEANPLRYRGYVYDIETGLYYLQSRYYGPEMGRFLISDVVFDYDVGIQGYNLYTYCGNNTVNRIDIGGADSDPIDDTKDLLEVKTLDGGGARVTISRSVYSNNSGYYKVKYGGTECAVYRGGNDFTVKSNEVKINQNTGNVRVTHGLSLDVNPKSLVNYGGGYRIDSIPKDLTIIQRGQRMEHFEIVPKYEMSLSTYQNLLYKVKYSGPY